MPPSRNVRRQAQLSHLRRPADLAPDAWQRQLRRQFGRAQKFKLENMGEAEVFSAFRVTNPRSGGRYRVAIRGVRPGDNFCACPDFATNDLGTCKHVEFVLAHLERRRGGKRALARGFRPQYSEIYLRYGSERQVRFRQGSGCPSTLARRAARLFTGPPAGVLPAERYAELEDFLARAQVSGHELRCYEDVLTFIARCRDAEHRRRTIDAAYPQGAATPTLQRLLKTKLYPYQAEGALFAARAGRCLIADEMGLGKTVQAIAAAELLAKHFGAEQVLVICPTSLKHQWQRELARFSEREAEVVSGTRAARVQCYSRPGFCKITNYDTLARDLELIRAWSPDLLIVDEAQRVKNWNTVAARALKRIESPYALVLTGTPLENRLEELVSIVQFVDGYRLGPLWRLRHEHQVLDESGKVVGYQNLHRIGETLRPILLRRRKADVLSQLPPRVAKTVFVPMTRPQMAEHQTNAAVVQQIVQRWRRTGYLSDVDQRRLMSALQNMRMVCNSTYLLDGKTDHGTKCDELVTLLDELLEKQDVKVVIFSQWLRTHELLARRFKARRWSHVFFHGGVPGGQRGGLVDRFHQDPACRVFLSTDAGGVGLNLQNAASVVVNMDLPWNPAVLEQRIGRVHRLGQTRGVQVVNFVAQGTIEEGMLAVLAFKKSLFAGVLDGGAREVFLGGSRLKRFMESVDAVTAAAQAESGTDVAAAAAAERDSRHSRRKRQSTDNRPSLDTGAGVALGNDRSSAPDANGGADQTASRQVTTTTAPAGSPQNQTPADSWAALLSTGLKLLEAMTAGQRGNGGETARDAGRPRIETDARTGKAYLRLPVPDPEAIRQLGDALSRLVSNLTPSAE